MAATPTNLSRLQIPARAAGSVKAPGLSLAARAPKARLTIPAHPSGSVTYGPPGNTFSGAQPTSLADYITQAKQLANQQVQAQVNAIQAQQTLASQQAAARAHEINQASAAAADYLQRTGLAGTLAGQDYQQAVNNTQSLASGFSGQLQHDAAAQAQQAQQSLAGVAGNTQQLSNKGDALANVLYGLGGYIPGNALNVQGLGAVAAARAVPGATLGYGQQQAANALQTGAGTVQSLAAQIAQAESQRPSITENLIGQFQNAYNSAQSQANQSAEIQSLINSRTAATQNAATQTRISGKKVTDAETKYNNSQIPHYDASQSKDGIQRDQFGNPLAGKGGYQQLEPGYHWENQNGQTVPVKNPPPVTTKDQSTLSRQWTATNHYQSDWQGNPLKGKIIPTAGYRVTADGSGVEPIPKPTKSSATKSAAAIAWSGLTQKALSQADDFYYGVAPKQVFNSKTQTWMAEPGTGKAGVLYPEARSRLLSMGPKTKAWRQFVNETLDQLYAEGEGGRPYSKKATDSAKAAGSTVGAAGQAASGLFGA